MMGGAARRGPWRRALPAQGAAILTPTCMKTPTWYLAMLPVCLLACLPACLPASCVFIYVCCPPACLCALVCLLVNMSVGQMPGVYLSVGHLLIVHLLMVTFRLSTCLLSSCLLNPWWQHKLCLVSFSPSAYCPPAGCLSAYYLVWLAAQTLRHLQAHHVQHGRCCREVVCTVPGASKGLGARGLALVPAMWSRQPSSG